MNLFLQSISNSYCVIDLNLVWATLVWVQKSYRNHDTKDVWIQCGSTIFFTIKVASGDLFSGIYITIYSPWLINYLYTLDTTHKTLNTWHNQFIASIFLVWLFFEMWALTSMKVYILISFGSPINSTLLNSRSLLTRSKAALRSRLAKT